MDLVYTTTDFLELLDKFQKAYNNKEYTERIPYNTWRELKKLRGPIKVEYNSPFVKISNTAVDMCGVEKDIIHFSAKVYGNGFGRFFYDYVVKENEKMISSKAIASIKACDTATATATAASATDYTKTDVAALEWKADYMQADDIDSTLTFTYDNGSTAGIASYGLTTVDTLKVAGKPLQTNTIELNIPSLDYLGYHQIDGAWDSVASKSDMEERFDKLEAELQKKVDKSEMRYMEKENDTKMKGINFDFGPCGDTVRLSMYGMAIQNISGEWVSYNPNSREIINVDVFNMADGGKYMYKMPVAIADVKVGDIVIHSRTPMFVTAVNENGTFEVTDVRAGETKNIIPTRNMFGFNFIIKVVSLFGAFTDAPTADQPFGNMLPFLMLGEGNKDIDPMMLFFMMNQGGTNIFSNPMMMYFMMKDNKDIDPMLMFMLMGQNKVEPHSCNCGNCGGNPAAQV